MESTELSRKSPKQLAKFIAVYWSALQVLFPGAFANPKQYRLQRYATSIVALHQIMPIILEQAVIKKGITESGKLREFLVRKLKKLQPLEEKFWSDSNKKGVLSYGTGYGAEGRFAEFLATTLKLV